MKLFSVNKELALAIRFLSDYDLIGTHKTSKAQVDEERKRSEIQQVKNQVREGKVVNPNAIVITQSDLQRMKVISAKAAKGFEGLFFKFRMRL